MSIQTLIHPKHTTNNLVINLIRKHNHSQILQIAKLISGDIKDINDNVNRHIFLFNYIIKSFLEDFDMGKSSLKKDNYIEFLSLSSRDELEKASSALGEISAIVNEKAVFQSVFGTTTNTYDRNIDKLTLLSNSLLTVIISVYQKNSFSFANRILNSENPEKIMDILSQEIKNIFVIDNNEEVILFKDYSLISKKKGEIKTFDYSNIYESIFSLAKREYLNKFSKHRNLAKRIMEVLDNENNIPDNSEVDFVKTTSISKLIIDNWNDLKKDTEFMEQLSISPNGEFGKISVYPTYEQLDDLVNNKMIKINFRKDIFELCSKNKDFMTDKVVELTEEILNKGVINKKDLKTLIFTKIPSYISGHRKIKDAVSAFEGDLEKVKDKKDLSLELLHQKLKEVNENTIVTEDYVFSIFNKTEYDKFKKVASPYWCIKRSKSYWNDYVKDNHIQIIYASSNKPSDFYGITVNLSSFDITAAHYHNDKELSSNIKNKAFGQLFFNQYDFIRDIYLALNKDKNESHFVRKLRSNINRFNSDYRTHLEELVSEKEKVFKNPVDDKVAELKRMYKETQKELDRFDIPYPEFDSKTLFKEYIETIDEEEEYLQYNSKNVNKHFF